MKKILIAMIMPVFLMVSDLSADELSWQSKVDDLIKNIITDKSIPGLSVVVMTGDKVSFSKAYGLSNVEMNIPSTMDTVYPISSVSKNIRRARGPIFSSRR